MSAPAIEIDAFRSALRLDDEALRELYSSFVHTLIQEGGRIRELVAVGRLREIEGPVHNIKGIAGGYRAQELYLIAAGLDKLLKLGTGPDLEEVTSLLLRSLDKTVEAVGLYFAD